MQVVGPIPREVIKMRRQRRFVKKAISAFPMVHVVNIHEDAKARREAYEAKHKEFRKQKDRERKAKQR